MDNDVNLASLMGWKTQVKHYDFKHHSIAVATNRPDPGPHGSLLLLHGFPTCAWDWHKMWPALGAQYQLIAPDFLGYGLSDKPQSHAYRTAEQSDLCEDILRTGHVDKCHVVSHDYGDTVVQELLARQASTNLSFEIQRVIMLNGGILPAAHRPRPIQKMLAGPLGPLFNHLLNKKRFKTSFCEVFGPDTQPVDAELNMLWELITHNDGHKNSHKLLHYIAERKLFEGRWVPMVLAPIVPMLLINGSLDPVSGAHLISAYRSEGGTADIIEMPNIGHYPHLEADERVAADILRFLRP